MFTPNLIPDIKKGDVEKLRTQKALSFRAEFTDINQETKPKLTLIGAAAFYKQTGILQFLLEEQAKSKQPLKFYEVSGKPVILWAMLGGSLKALALLVYHGYDISAIQPEHLQLISATNPLRPVMQAYFEYTRPSYNAGKSEDNLLSMVIVETRGWFGIKKSPKPKAIDVKQQISTLTDALLAVIKEKNNDLSEDQAKERATKLLKLEPNLQLVPQ